MFTSQHSGTTKKVFQKPNILRRKPKVKREAQKYAEPPDSKPLITTLSIEDNSYEPANRISKTRELYPLLDNETKSAVLYSALTLKDESGQTSPVAEEKFLGTRCAKAENEERYCEASKTSQEIQATLPQDKQNNPFYKHEIYMVKSSLFDQQDNYYEDQQSSLNIESFLVDSPNKQSIVVSNDSSTLTTKKTETEVESKWCLNFMSDDSKDIIIPSFNDGAQISKGNTDITTNPVSFSNEINFTKDSSIFEQDMIQSCLTSRVVKYKCDMPNCNKSFWNEARLQKHQTIHSKKKSNTNLTAVECPVKKVDNDGEEQKCGKLFLSKEILMNHLNEDHIPEDASYRCVRCGRRFWWATGMRTHAQNPCTRALTCTWLGCGRVFRLPCRLREHVRAHTGDRPYPCEYPNCGWAFRSASKLMRHVRRHTGERKHECAACGRTFPRREHLRDHAARHHARNPTPCTHQGCEETFANTSSLYVHLKRAHQPEGSKPAPRRKRASKKKAPADMIVMTLNNGTSHIKYDSNIPDYSSIADAIETANASAMIMPEAETVDNDYMVLGEPERVEETKTEVIEAEEAEGFGFGYDLEGKCARTHCTWPLQRMPVLSGPAYTIEEEDTQVEPSEGSESNIFTVRSDLFLHGNVLINEDSEFTIRESSNRAASEAEETSNTGQLDGLDLIDSHPTIDLMQEELMYDDAAVDESSFRVFLMNGEELS